MSFQYVIDYFLADKIKMNPDLIRKGRMVVLIYFFLIALIPIIGIWAWTQGNPNEFPYPIAILSLLVFLFIFKKYGFFYLSGHFLGLMVFALLIPSAYISGGLYSDDIIWLLLGPVMAFLVGNKWTGLFWSFVLICTIGVFYYIDINSPESLIKDSMIRDQLFYASSLMMMFTLLLGIIFIYENEKTKLIEEIGEKRNELVGQNEHLEEIVNERTLSLKKSNAQLEKSNAQLKSSNEDLEQFAYVASHDLQEPLRMVGNFVQLLEDEYKEQLGDEGKMYINYAVDGVSRMSVLIEELLQYSRVGKKDEQIELVDLNQVIEQKKSDLSLVIKKKNVSITHGTLPKIHCIKGQVGILFYNLVNNGIKFNQSFNPKIEIGYKEETKEWVFYVKDNGVGIPKPYQEQIFELFKRLHRKEEYSGTGIGLSVCRKIVEQHKGRIWLESEEGLGTTFFFSIPKDLSKEIENL